MKNRKVFLATMLTMAFGMQAHAGLPGLEIPGAATAEAAAATATAGTDMSGNSQEAIVQNFANALGIVLKGQAELDLAFGNKESAAALTSMAEAMAGGATTKADIKKATEVSAEAQESNAEKLAAGEELSDEARAHYVNGLVLSAEGVIATKALSQDAADFGASAKDQISSASMMKKAKLIKSLSAGMFVAKELPGFTADLMKNFEMLVTYANSAEIPVPADATDFLAAL